MTSQHQPFCPAPKFAKVHPLPTNVHPHFLVTVHFFQREQTTRKKNDRKASCKHAMLNKNYLGQRRTLSLGTIVTGRQHFLHLETSLVRFRFLISKMQSFLLIFDLTTNEIFQFLRTIALKCN